MCDTCGNANQDILMRALSYGGIRWAEGTSIINKIEKEVEETINVKEERIPSPMVLAQKTAVNALVDYGYDKWIYPKYKMGYGEKIGFCECEYMKGIWQLMAQVLYEKGMHGKITGGGVLKDIIAIFGQFPVRKLILQYTGK